MCFQFSISSILIHLAPFWPRQLYFCKNKFKFWDPNNFYFLLHLLGINECTFVCLSIHASFGPSVLALPIKRTKYTKGNDIIHFYPVFCMAKRKAFYTSKHSLAITIIQKKNYLPLAAVQSRAPALALDILASLA